VPKKKRKSFPYHLRIDMPGGANVGVQHYAHVSSELQETVREAAHKVQLMIASAKHKSTVICEFVQSLQHSHLISYAVCRA
jgi:hypothetical protein